MKENKKYPYPPFDEPLQQPPGSEQKMDLKPDHGEQSYKGCHQMEGKCVVITGADSGIGKAVAIAFAREGADVVIAYLDKEEKEDALETLYWVEKAGRKGLLFEGDLRHEETCRKLIESAISNFKKIDVLINNAAFQMSRKKLEDIPSEEWIKTFETNIHPIFYLCRHATKHMPAGSSIINTSSVNAVDPNPTLLPYAATKAAIRNLTGNLNQYFLENDLYIRVNAVAPGPVWTPLISSTFPKKEVDTFGHDNPMKRPAQPAEIAPAYVFLASEGAGYISGITLPVTGGRLFL